MREKFEMMVHYDGRDLFLIVDGGVKIAKRGDMVWIPLEPGWTVRDDPYPDAITMEYQGRVVGTLYLDEAEEVGTPHHASCRSALIHKTDITPPSPLGDPVGWGAAAGWTDGFAEG